MKTRYDEELGQPYVPSGKEVIAAQAIMLGIAILAAALHLS